MSTISIRSITEQSNQFTVIKYNQDEYNYNKIYSKLHKFNQLVTKLIQYHFKKT